MTNRKRSAAQEAKAMAKMETAVKRVERAAEKLQEIQETKAAFDKKRKRKAAKKK